MRVNASIYQGANPDLGHTHAWSVSIEAPGWGDDINHEDPGFDTLQEAYDYIGRWAKGRGVQCATSFAYLISEPIPENVECPRCEGEGMVGSRSHDDPERVVCPRCHGSRRENVEEPENPPLSVLMPRQHGRNIEDRIKAIYRTPGNVEEPT